MYGLRLQAQPLGQSAFAVHCFVQKPTVFAMMHLPPSHSAPFVQSSPSAFFAGVVPPEVVPPLVVPPVVHGSAASGLKDSVSRPPGSAGGVEPPPPPPLGGFSVPVPPLGVPLDAGQFEVPEEGEPESLDEQAATRETRRAAAATRTFELFIPPRRSPPGAVAKRNQFPGRTQRIPMRTPCGDDVPML